MLRDAVDDLERRFALDGLDDAAADLRVAVRVLAVDERERDARIRARFRALRDVDCVKNAMRPSSRIAQSGIECGAPSGSTVARCTKFRPSVKSAAIRVV